jgi:hypothetical protein
MFWLAMVVLVSQIHPITVLAEELGTPVAPAVEATTLPPGTPDDAGSPTTSVGEPTEVPIETPVEPTATPTEVPARPTDVPAIQATLANQPECTLAPEQADQLVSGSFLDYRCTSHLMLEADPAIDTGSTITWQINARVTTGWIVRLHAAADASSNDPAWSTFADGQTSLTVTGPGPSSQTATITYRMRIERPACLTGVPEIELRHDAAVAATGVNLITTEREPLRITPAIAPIPEPSIAFTGGLDFGSITATARGLSTTQVDGVIGITVTGLDQACGTWNLLLASTPIVDATGAPRDGFALMFGACNLVDGCLAATLLAGPGAPASITHTYTLTLQAPQHAAPGAIGTTLDANLSASAGE